jgi:dihydrolipoamide dehydrogenase
MKKRTFDIAVLGSGPGGYVAAIRAARRNRSVALIEAGDIGGTCLNRGCIPSKALLATSTLMRHIREADHLGINVAAPHVNYPFIITRKDQVVTDLRQSLEGLIKSHGITIVRGRGTFIRPDQIQVTGTDGGIIEAPRIIVASGSLPRSLDAAPVDGIKIHNSDTILDYKTPPKRIAIIGGGVIGCEFASFFSGIGVDVTIIEMLERILPLEAPETVQLLHDTFTQHGVKIHTSAIIQGIKGTTITLKNATIEADSILVAIGRTANNQNMGFEKIGLSMRPNGTIPVNDRQETNIPGIYAIGDITGSWQLAHYASHQGIVAADNASGHSAHMDESAVPSVIFTDPEIASVGLSLERAKRAGFQAFTSRIPLHILGKAQATHETEGFAQLVVERSTGRILGAQAIGHEATSLIAPLVLAIRNEITTDALAETIHAHPTLPEAWVEAAYLAEGLPIHLPPSALTRLFK